MFCDKCCVCIDICVFIIVKIKYVNYGRICNIYDKVNFTINYTYFIISDRHLSKHTQHFIRTHTNITNFDTFDRTISQQDLRLSPHLMLWNSNGRLKSLRFWVDKPLSWYMSKSL